MKNVHTPGVDEQKLPIFYKTLGVDEQKLCGSDKTPGDMASFLMRIE